MSLYDLIDNNLTDKNTSHSYLETYQRLFNNKKYDYLNILEIGIGEPKSSKQNGGSIKMWHDYFINSKIYGLDIYDITKINEQIINKDRINLYTSINAYDVNFINKEFIQKNIKFDILIDDGPHTYESMVFFIKNYLYLLNADGLMIIEDIPNIEWTNTFINLVKGDNTIKNIEVVDLRYKKNRWDDIMLVIYK
jgi:hypothetical protein